LKIGILALQGDFIEHQKILNGFSIETVQVRKAAQLDQLNGLIIPGGESTTIGKLAVDFELMSPLRSFSKTKAVWGTCAGTVFLSKDARRDQPLMSVMNIQIARNAFGRQVDSFEVDLDIPALKLVSESRLPFHAIFIRAPLIESVSGETEVLATLPDGRIVAAREGKLLATSFHPELTGDDRFHRYFLEMAK